MKAKEGTPTSAPRYSTVLLHKRAAEVRSRAAVRRWEYKQLRHSKGMWFRLRRTLAGASEAFEINESGAQKLIDSGRRPEPVGFEMHPPKMLIFVTKDEVGGIAEARPIPVNLGAAMLAARFVALVPFVSEFAPPVATR